MSMMYYLFYSIGFVAIGGIMWALYREISEAYYMNNHPHYTILDESDISRGDSK